MDGDGRPKLLLSSRTGADYRRNPRTGTTTTSEIVLGRRDGEVWQAVMDPADGRVVVETRFEAVPGAPHDSARPYGLLQAAPLEPDALPSVVLVSCQVEEFAVVTHRTATGGLRRHDGWFVEKDWPNDERELRPQPTSLADLRGDGRPLLVVGLWRDGAWRTLVLDPRGGLEDPLATLPGRYFWGCHDVDGDGRPEILTSRETHRTPRARSTLEAWRGTDGRRIANLAASRDPRVDELAAAARRRVHGEPAERDRRLARRTGGQASWFAARARTDRRSARGLERAAIRPSSCRCCGAHSIEPMPPGTRSCSRMPPDDVAQVGFDGGAARSRSVEVNGRLATPLAGPS